MSTDFQVNYKHTVSLEKIKWANNIADKMPLIGRLALRWLFPSDHLPVGVKCDKIRLVSWNVLNNFFMRWITDDKQGLNGSMITQLHSDHPGLTKRDEKVAEFTRKMCSRVDVIGQQECSSPYLKHLEQTLPDGWDLIKSCDTDVNDVKDQVALLYKRTKLTLLKKETVFDAMPSAPGRPVQKVTLQNQETGRVFVVINAHIPGKRDLPARQEFAHFVKKATRPDATTVVLGDNNFLRGDMISAYKAANLTEFKLHSPWNTIIADNKQSKCIDHILVQNSTKSRNLTPSEILPKENNLSKMTEILNPQSINPSEKKPKDQFYMTENLKKMIKNQTWQPGPSMKLPKSTEQDPYG